MSDVALAVCAAGSLLLVIGAYSVRVAKFGRALDARLDHEAEAGATIRFVKEAVHWILRAVATDVTPRWLTPDHLTVMGLLMTLGCIPLVALGYFGGAALLLLAGSAFDVLDGAVARSRGLGSPAGEMLDAVFDRYADVAPLAGMALFYRPSPWALVTVLLAITGALLVSYVRAKAESFGLDLPSGFMRRPERVALLFVAFALGSICPVSLAGTPRAPTLIVVAIVGLLSHRDALILLRQARAQLRTSDVVPPHARKNELGQEPRSAPGGSTTPEEAPLVPNAEHAERR